MRLLQDGVVAALAAIGLTAVIFLLVSAIVHPRRRGTIPATAVIETWGGAKTPPNTVGAVLRSGDGAGRLLPGGIGDRGLAGGPPRGAGALCRGGHPGHPCQREELTDFFT